MLHWFIWGCASLLLCIVALLLLVTYAAVSPLLAYLLAINFTSFLVYGLDKRAGKYDHPSRAPEPFLVLLALFGGSVGALAGVYAWNHKTKRKFAWLRITLLVILLGQIALAWLWSSRHSG